MATHTGLRGAAYTLAQKHFAGGGEGNIYAINGANHLVAKVNHAKRRTTEREQKIIAMLGNPPSAQDVDQFAWPVDLLYENNRFAGYIMPRLNNPQALNEVYVYDDRKGIPWDFYISVAKNLAAVIHCVHKIGHVCGDLNPDNISVNKQGVITLLDNDSYHIKDINRNRVFRCEVGCPEYVPRELQGINLASAPLPTYTKETDNFTLAVMIFCLLMNGSHPFACSISRNSVSASQFQPVSNIRRGTFPFMQPQTGLSIPKYAPPVDILSDELQDLFKQAFVGGHIDPKARPTPDKWYYALDHLSRSLKKCGKDSSHQFYSGLNSCPWCEVERNMKGTSSTGQPNIRQAPYTTPPPLRQRARPGSTAAGTTSGYRRTTPGGTSTAAAKKVNWKPLVILIFLGLLLYSAVNAFQLFSGSKTYMIDNHAGDIRLDELEIGTSVVDKSWQWEFRPNDDYTGSGTTKPVKWIVVAINHYDDTEPHVTLLSEELIGRIAFDNSTDREIIRSFNLATLEHGYSSSNMGCNNWANSGKTNATYGLRPWLNSNGIHSGEGFYSVFSDEFKNAIVQTVVPNRETRDGETYTTLDNVFVPSTKELGSNYRHTYSIGHVYPLFNEANNDDRIAYLNEATTRYWTRSPSSSYANSVCVVVSNGSIGSGVAMYGPSGIYGPLPAVRPAVNLRPDTMVTVIEDD